MFIPKKVKHRKHQKGRFFGQSKGALRLAFGSYGLKAQSSGWLTARQIEAARRAMTRYVQRGGKIWIRVFPDKPVTTHGAVMGGGKGNVDHFVCVVKRGRVIFEMDGVAEDQAREAMRLASHKLPLLTGFVSKSMVK
ncbi:MAG: 50S ribosomal protein L16 [Candidatus Doudnabacteria bacterium]|nr:50S ribosomal protein L16 [Candidatus Doudnabacteria bacterium]